MMTFACSLLKMLQRLRLAPCQLTKESTSTLWVYFRQKCTLMGITSRINVCHSPFLMRPLLAMKGSWQNDMGETDRRQSATKNFPGLVIDWKHWKRATRSIYSYSHLYSSQLGKLHTAFMAMAKNATVQTTWAENSIFTWSYSIPVVHPSDHIH